LHFCWLTAHLYEEQIFAGVNAVTQACCEPVLQSTTEQCGVHFAQTSAAVYFCWLTAHLYEEQISIGLIAMTRDCCEPVLQALLNSVECILPRPVLNCISVGSLHTCMKSKSAQV